MNSNDISKDPVSPLVLWGHWFTFINILLAMLVASRYLVAEGWPDTPLGQVYMVTNWIGHFAFLGFITYLIALFPVTLLLPYSRILRGYGATIATLAQSALLFDTQVFAHYRLHLNPFVFDLAANDLNALLKNPVLLLVPVAIMALQLLIANGLWKRLKRFQRRRIGSKVTTVLVCCFGFSHLVHAWADATVYRPITTQDEIFPLHYPFTAKRFMARQGLLDDESVTERELTAAPTHQLNYPTAPLQCRPQQRPDILMVVVDGWRADLVDNTTMPRLLAYGEKNQWFSQHYSGSNEFHYGLFTLLYSMLPSYEPSLSADLKPPVLNQQLQQAGYRLTLYGDHELSGGRHMVALFSGFDQKLPPESDVAAERDIATTNQVLADMIADTDPQFRLVTYRSPALYSTPVGYLGIPTTRPESQLNYAEQILYNQYRQSLSFLDEELARLLAGTDEQTLVILTGSRGKVFTTDMGRGNHDNYSQPAVQVPLVIHWPGAKARRFNRPTSHYGLVPALMSDLLNCHNPIRQYSLGESLFQPQALPYLVMGNGHSFAIRNDEGTTVINDAGEFRVFGPTYQRQRDVSLDVPTLLGMMEEGRRFRSQ
ncbi:DUF3413 domain-containing protein [Ferrimonas gelatinilytica]|uniref:DUF3413 domain-containing protein n=1 Tax=Ferrimonas gelatinilytica TaxID=1255257 RepID=A0ABP9RWX1_9GAMM